MDFARTTVNQYVESSGKCQGGSLADTKRCVFQSTAAAVLTPGLYQTLKYSPLTRHLFLGKLLLRDGVGHVYEGFTEEENAARLRHVATSIGIS